MSNIDFENIKDKAIDFAQAGMTKACEITDAAIEKGRQLAEITKLKLRNTSEREHIKKSLLALGKLYYAERGAAPDGPFAELCEAITAAQARIDYNSERIADLKAAGNLTDEEVEHAGDAFCGEEAPLEPESPDEPEEEKPEDQIER